METYHSPPKKISMTIPNITRKSTDIETALLSVNRIIMVTYCRVGKSNKA